MTGLGSHGEELVGSIQLWHMPACLPACLPGFKACRFLKLCEQTLNEAHESTWFLDALNPYSCQHPRAVLAPRTVNNKLVLHKVKHPINKRAATKHCSSGE
jgi:hypothetical protein